MRLFSLLTLLITMALAAMAQTIDVQPTMTPDGGAYDDNVTVSCTFPIGCTGGIYWFNGGELNASKYNGPINIDYSCNISVAGVNASGRIITDIVTRKFTINRVTPPSCTAMPKEGVRNTSFYVTKMKWNNVTKSELALDDFKEGGSRHGEYAVWLTNEMGITVAYNDYNGLWSDGLNQYKAYIYKNYDNQRPGKYVLHIAKGVFKIDGEIYNEELQFNYEVARTSAVPVFSPEEGEYEGPLQVTISYPTDGSAFYKVYKIGSKTYNYSSPFTITESCTIEAWGIDEDFYSETEVTKATYIIKQPETPAEPLASPTISRNGDEISIAAVEGATIKYWLNDNMNTAAIYTGPFTVSENGKVACIAYNETSKSNTVEFAVTGFDIDRGDLGEQLLITPGKLETVHLYAISPNGRYAVGFTGSDTSSKGFIWDLTADNFQYQSTIFVNQLWSISNDGTAYGWRLTTTEVDDQIAEEDFIWGTCKDGVWTRQPDDMVVNGIAADGMLYGNLRSEAVKYDMASKQYVHYTAPGASRSEITVAGGNGVAMGGYVIMNGKKIACVWTDANNIIVLDNVEADNNQVTAISTDGTWAIVGQDYRVNTSTGYTERIISMTDRYNNTHNPEVLMAIADDGNIFGTYDPSLLSPEKGIGMIYTTDKRWRGVEQWLAEEKNVAIDNYYITSVRGISADMSTILMHVVQNNMSADDVYTRGVALSINVPVKHLAPVSVKAEQVSGVDIAKISWQAPISNAEDVTGYSVKRNDEIIANVANTEFTYYDENVEAGNTYTYCVTATYADGRVSLDSYPCELTVKSGKYQPVRDLALRRAGLNDVVLTWDAPVVSIPKLQYFNEESEWFAFGTASYNSEWGIRIPASDLLMFEGQQIRTFQFLPSGPQAGYTLNLYKGTTGNEYEAEPFYSQAISIDDLNFGTVNTIELDEPQELPIGKDLYVGLLIETNGNDDMLGISYEGFRSGYSDLCRVVDVFPCMLPISQNSSVATEVVLPLGIGICTEDGYNSNVLKNYEVTDNNAVIDITKSPRLNVENVSEGEHEFAVKAIYRNDVASDKQSITVDMKNNMNAYVPVDSVRIEVDTDKKAHISWDTPLDDDMNLIHWGDLNPQPGWQVPDVLGAFYAGVIIPQTITSPYAYDYEITDIYFHPTDEAIFEITLDDGINGILAEEIVSHPTVGETKYVHLSEPISIEPSCNYQINLGIYDFEIGCSPLAYDSSNHWRNGYSNLVNYGYDWGTLNDFVQVNERPNWFAGLVIRRKDAKPLPLTGYNVSIDGNSTSLTENSLTTEALADGQHSVAVDVVYTPAITVSGKQKNFNVGETDGINEISNGLMNGRRFDLLGRRIEGNYINGKPNFTISAGKKVLNIKK